MTPTKRLTDKQRARYAECKKIISEKLHYCFEVGSALMEIRDGELFIEDFDTFPEFALEVYGIAQSHAYRLIEAAEVKNSVSHSPIGGKLTTERQARELAKVPENKRVKALKLAEKNGGITGESIAQAAKEIQAEYEPKEPPEVAEPKKPKFPVDATGYKIPEQCLPMWERRQEVQELLTQISKLKCLMEKLKADDDILYLRSASYCIDHLTQTYTHLADSKPYAVCTQCEGNCKNGCGQCYGSGFISEWRYNTTSRKEIKDIRAKQISEYA